MNHRPNTKRETIRTYVREHPDFMKKNHIKVAEEVWKQLEAQYPTVVWSWLYVLNESLNLYRETRNELAT